MMSVAEQAGLAVIGRNVSKTFPATKAKLGKLSIRSPLKFNAAR
jgi:hypothetical protein